MGYDILFHQIHSNFTYTHSALIQYLCTTNFMSLMVLILNLGGSAYRDLELLAPYSLQPLLQSIAHAVKQPYLEQNHDGAVQRRPFSHTEHWKETSCTRARITHHQEIVSANLWLQCPKFLYMLLVSAVFWLPVVTMIKFFSRKNQRCSRIKIHGTGFSEVFILSPMYKRIPEVQQS